MAWLGRFDDFNNISTGSNNIPTATNMWLAARTTRSDKPPVSGATRRDDVPSVACKGQPGYCKISQITNKMNNAAIVGVVISRESPRSVVSKRGSGCEKHLLALTVCDAPLWFIGVTCWGSSEFVQFLASEIHLGDIVDIKGAHVQAKSTSSSDEKFRPWTPSPCHLSLSESQGTVDLYTGVDAGEYVSLLHVPTRAGNDFYTLEDIEANGMSLHGEHINLLVVLTKIYPVKELTTKSGKKTKKVDVVVCDETCPTFHLVLWDSFVSLTETWLPLETVLFAADVKIMYSEFRSTMVASTSSKTIITVDPDTPEAQSLRQFGLHHGSLLSAQPDCPLSNKDPDVDTITNVLTVRAARNLQHEVSQTGQPGYAVVFAFLSQFDVDSDTRTIFKQVCCRCRRRVSETSAYMCTTPSCADGNKSHDPLHELEYSITVSLTDHTGSLDSCSLLPGVAEEMLQCKASHFKILTEAEKTSAKWNYLLERTRAVIKIRRADDRPGGRCFIHILAMEKMSPQHLVDQ